MTPLPSRRRFLETSGTLLAGFLLAENGLAAGSAPAVAPGSVKVSAHLYVYGSKFPPQSDATPVLETAFRDVQGSGMDGIELMAVNLRHDDAVERIGRLSERYQLPITGTSFSANFWDVAQHAAILADATVVINRLSQLKGKTFGISVGNVKRPKTEAELDAQAELLKRISAVCQPLGVEPNLHNHTYEVENGLHDLKGTLARLPDIKLGPDLNWLIRGGVDPVWFIETYGDRMTYLHLRDQYADGTWTEYLGQGSTDFPAIARALKAKNFRGSAGIELAFPPKYVPQQPLPEVWKRSRDYVKTTFGW